MVLVVAPTPNGDDVIGNDGNNNGDKDTNCSDVSNDGNNNHNHLWQWQWNDGDNDKSDMNSDDKRYISNTGESVTITKSVIVKCKKYVF